MMELLWSGQPIHVPTLSYRYDDLSTRTIRGYINIYILPLFPGDIEFCSHNNHWKATSNLKTKSTLTPSELVALSRLEHHSSSFQLGQLKHSAIKMLRKYRRAEFRNELIKNTKIESLEGFRDDYNLLLNAIRDRKVVHCIYNKKKRVLEPVYMLLVEGFWYLHVMDVCEDGTKKSKSFHFKSISDISVQDENFTAAISDYKKFKNAINAYFSPENDPIKVEMAVYKSIIKYFRRIPISPSQDIIGAIDEDWYEVHIEVTNHEEILPTIKQYLPNIIVRKPLSLRDEVQLDIDKYTMLLEANKDDEVDNSLATS